MQIAIILLFLVGVILVLAEILMPGVIFGLFGLGCVIAAIAWAFDRGDTTLAWSLLIVALVLVPILVVVWLRVFKRYAVRHTEAGYESADKGLAELVGQEGVTLTMLRPAGAALIASRRVDVVADGEIIEKDTRVKVIAVEGYRVVVRAVRA